MSIRATGDPQTSPSTDSIGHQVQAETAPLLAGNEKTDTLHAPGLAVLTAAGVTIGVEVGIGRIPAVRGAGQAAVVVIGSEGRRIGVGVGREAQRLEANGVMINIDLTRLLVHARGHL